MRIVFSICILLAALIAGGCAVGKGESIYRAGYDFSKMDKIAIVAVEGAVRGEQAKNQIAEFFAMELLKRGYAPVGRAQVKALLASQELSSANLTTVEGATKAGKILKVPVVLVVNVPHFGEEISMTAVMVDVEDGSFLWMGIGSDKTGGGFMSNLLGGGTEAGTIAGGEEGQILSGAISGQFGGEQPLTPSESKRVQKIVTKICTSLPPHAGLQKVKTGIWPVLF